MRKDLEGKFQERWPGWFDLDGDPRKTAMAWGFAHGDGWFDLVWRLCEQIEPIVLAGKAETRERETPLDATKHPPFEVRQVKEKFGGLRFYNNSRNPVIWLIRRKRSPFIYATFAASLGHFGRIAQEGAGYGPNAMSTSIPANNIEVEERRHRASVAIDRGEQMQPNDFKIGMEFLMSRNKWRCTDVGSRTVAAIKLEPDAEPGLYNGPPYKVVEVVIDEFSLKGCSIWDDAPDASDTEELDPDTEAGDMQSGTITPRAFKLSLSRRSQLFPARGVLLIDQGLEALVPLMRSRNFRVHKMPANLDEQKIINPSLEDGEIGSLLSQRVLVTNRAELFREAAAVHEFSIIDTVERPWINERLAGEISRRWFLIAGPSRPPSIVWIGRNGVSRFEPVD